MGRASQMIARIENAIAETKRVAPEILRTISKTRIALETRDRNLVVLLKLIDTIEKARASGKLTKNMFQDMHVKIGLIAANNRDLATWEAALEIAMKKAVAVVDMFKFGEIDKLIKDKINKENQKGTKSKNLDALIEAYKRLIRELDGIGKHYKTLRAELKPEVVSLPDLPYKEPAPKLAKRYLDDDDMNPYDY